MNVKELLSFKPASMTPSREQTTEQPVRKRPKMSVSVKSDESGILKKGKSEARTKSSKKVEAEEKDVSHSSNDKEIETEITEEERQRILRMVEQETEVPITDEASVKRMISVLEKKIAKNQEMRIKFPDSPEKFMESEFELHQAIQELHALPAAPSLYFLAVELSVIPTLLGLLSHENADISCSVLELLKEMTDDDADEENQECVNFLVDSLLDHQTLPLLIQNLDRFDESSKDEADGVFNTLTIFENLFETRSHLCKVACENGLLKWVLKRVRPRVPFDPNKLYAAEIMAILLQDSQENRATAGELDGIDILLQQLAAYKRHDPGSAEEAEYMKNIFNCMCSALLYGPNKEKFLKGEGPQLMNLMLREKKQSRGGALKVLNYSVSGADGAANANKIVEILGLRSLFPLFMRTPKKMKRKGLSAMEHEEHVISIIAGLIRHTTGSNRSRVFTKFDENDYEKVERIGELHFKYLSKVNEVDRGLRDAMMELGKEVDEDELYLKRIDGGLFILQQIDYIIVELCAQSSKIKDRIVKTIALHRGKMSTISDIVREYSNSLGENSGTIHTDNEEWTAKQQANIDRLLRHFEA